MHGVQEQGNHDESLKDTSSIINGLPTNSGCILLDSCTGFRGSTDKVLHSQMYIEVGSPWIRESCERI